jgi:hypothetical protein
VQGAGCGVQGGFTLNGDAYTRDRERVKRVEIQHLTIFFSVKINKT